MGGGYKAGFEEIRNMLLTSSPNAIDSILSKLSPEQSDIISQYDEISNAINGYKEELEGVEAYVDILRDSYRDANKELREQERLLEEQQKYERSPQAYDDALTGNKIDDDIMMDALAEQFGVAGENVGAFAAHLNEAKISAELLGSVGTTAFSQLAEQAQQVFPEDGLQTQLAAVQQGMQIVNDFGIDPKYITLTDNGAFVEYEGHLIDFNNMTIDGKSFEVTSNGTFEVEKGKAVELQGSMNRLDATITRPKAILDDQTTEPLTKINAQILGLPTGMINISDNTYEVLGHIIDLNNTPVESKVAHIDVDGSAAEGEAEQVNNKLDEVNSNNPRPTIDANDNANSVINSVRSNLNSLDGKTATTHTYNYTHNVTINSTKNGGGHASGGISIPMNASGGVSIPAYASGAVNGIATGPTIVREGLVGEAGTEALLNMGRRRAIVPLSNRRYVRPFARAVAAEMGGSSGGQTVINNYSINGVQVPEGSAAADALKALYDALRV